MLIACAHAHSFRPDLCFPASNWPRSTGSSSLVADAIATIGFTMMVSAGGGGFSPWATPQLIRFGIAFVLMIILALMPMRMLMDYAYVIYFVCLLVLVGVDIMGHTGMGAKRWLSLGGLNLQPSEFMKLALILVLARYFHQLHPEDIRRFPFLIPPVLLIIVPAILILREPNLGTTTILVSVGAVMCFLAGRAVALFHRRGGGRHGGGAGGVAFHARLPEAARADIPQSRSGSAGRRL